MTKLESSFALLIWTIFVFICAVGFAVSFTENPKETEITELKVKLTNCQIKKDTNNE